MTTARRIRTFLWGDFDLPALSRANFLPLALKMLFIRLPITMILVYACICILESSKAPKLLQWIFCVIGLGVGSCFWVPYCMLLYKRLQGTLLPFPRAVFCLLIALYLFFPGFHRYSWVEAVISCVLHGVVYGILFLLPDNDDGVSIQSEGKMP